VLTPAAAARARRTPAASCSHRAQGAATQVYLATSPDVKAGEYYADCNISPSTPASRDLKLGQELWALSEKMVP
jgi:hypothetical protein